MLCSRQVLVMAPASAPLSSGATLKILGVGYDLLLLMFLPLSSSHRQHTQFPSHPPRRDPCQSGLFASSVIRTNERPPHYAVLFFSMFPTAGRRICLMSRRSLAMGQCHDLSDFTCPFLTVSSVLSKPSWIHNGCRWYA